MTQRRSLVVERKAGDLGARRPIPLWLAQHTREQRQVEMRGTLSFEQRIANRGQMKLVWRACTGCSQSTVAFRPNARIGRIVQAPRRRSANAAANGSITGASMREVHRRRSQHGGDPRQPQFGRHDRAGERHGVRDDQVRAPRRDAHLLMRGRQRRHEHLTNQELRPSHRMHHAGDERAIRRIDFRPDVGVLEPGVHHHRSIERRHSQHHRVATGLQSPTDGNVWKQIAE